MKPLPRPTPHVPQNRPTEPRQFAGCWPAQFLSLALAAGVAVSTQASSVLDSFNDVGGATNGITLTTLNTTGSGGIGFTSKYEQTGSGVPVLRTNDLAVPLANYVSGQTAQTQHWSVAAVTASAGAARRTQTRSTPTLSGTIWFSFLASLTTTNGDVGLVFNGGFNAGGSGTPASANATPGMRVGLGSNTRAAFRGALGVGPATAGANALEITNIVNGINGAVTAAGFVPTDGTAVLILGRIDSDPGNGLPRVSLWYNPDVASQANLPAPTLTFTDQYGTNVPTTVSRIGYQVNRTAAPASQLEIIDNVKVSDEPNAFDIVYKNAPLPIPIVNVIGTATLVGSETGPTNLVFTLTTDKPVIGPLTVSYTITGVATNGDDGSGGFVDADFTDTNHVSGNPISSVTIPNGATNVSVVLQVVNDSLPEGNESATLTLQASPSTYILGASSVLTGTILDDNDANVSLQYMFTRTLLPQVWDTNLLAVPAVTTGIGNGSYSGAYFISPDAAYSAGGDSTASNAANAVANGDYMGLSISPVAGRSLTLTNLEFQAIYGNFLFQVPEAAQAVVFVRSSLDNFTTNIAELVLQPDSIIFPAWYSNHIDLDSSFSNIPGQVEFRLYIYDDSNHNQVGVRIDNLYFSGTTAVLPPGINQVSVSTNVINAAEPATAGQFTITRIGDLTNPLTVNYAMTGTAANGVDYTNLPGLAVIAAGESNVVVTVAPLDDELPETAETVTLSLATGASYGILAPSSATVNIADDGDLGIGAVAVYFFNENNNTAPTLSATAAPTIKLTNLVAALNATVGTGLGTFGQNGSAAGIGHGYANSLAYSAPSTFYYRGEFWSTNADQALAGGDHLSLTVGAAPGHSVTLTNFSARVRLQPTSGQTGTAFLRSSLDNFATDVGSISVPGTDVAADPWLLWSVPLALTNIVGAVEFRFYAYGTRISGNDILRLDDATFYGSAGALPPGVQVVTASATDSSAAEPAADTGTFTLTRYGDSTSALTVNYAIGGTALSGVDYVSLSGTANFAAGETNVLITVAPLNDNRPELTETVTLSLLNSPNYSPGFYSTATVNLTDDGDSTPLFTFSTTDTNAYERVASLLGTFTLNRTLGDMSTTLTLNFTLGGTAVLGVDYVSSATNSVSFPPGVTTQTIQINPLNNAQLNGDRTVTLTVQTDPGFILDPPTSGTVTIVDDEVATETVLWSDTFDAGTSAANYTVKAGSDLGVDDYVADFAFDYSTIGVPPAPGSSTTVGLMMNANALGAAAGVNFYPLGQNFSNDFALRFNLYVSMDPVAGADNEAAYFGINQSGLATNWLSALSGVYTNYGEGIWATIATRDGTPGIASLFAATNSGSAPLLVGATGNLPDLFNSPPYGQLGRPNNAYDSTNKTWIDCELSQLGGIISLKLNNNVVLQYVNATPFTNGNIFLGYGDPFATLGSANCFAVFDDVRVVKLVATATQPQITRITVTGNSVEITFTAGAADVASAFKLQSSGAVASGYLDDNSAVVTASGSGQFKATTILSGGMQFYRIRR